jgi:glycosyltransferase involved in cell wall biosynthesis
MKIAFITETYPPEINGVALTVQSLVLHCRKLGHFVELWRPWQPAPELQASQPLDGSAQRLILEHLVPGARLPFYAGLRFGFPAKSRLLTHWRRYRPDGVYVATEGPLGWSAVAAARALGIPVVTGLHTRFDDFMGHYGIGLLRRPAFTFMRYFHNRAQATLVPTRSLQNWLLARGFRAVERLQRAVDTQQFAPAFRCNALRASWGANAEAPALLFVGRIAPEKNLPLAIQAFAKIRSQYPGARLVWVGDGPALAALKAELAHDSGHIFCGMLRGAALARAYASADIFLFPSLSETFGNVTLEALASGVPVCAFDYGAAEEAIVNDINGVRIAFGDALEFVAAANRLAQQYVLAPEAMRAAARASVAELDPAQVAVALVALLRRLGASDGAAANGPSRAAKNEDVEPHIKGVQHVQLKRL